MPMLGIWGEKLYEGCHDGRGFMEETGHELDLAG